MQQANGNRLHTGLAQRPRALPDLLLIERDDDLSERRGDALFDGEPVAPPRQRADLPGQFLLQRKIMRFLVTCDVEDVAETLGGDQTDLGALVLKDDVGGNRGAVQ